MAIAKITLYGMSRWMEQQGDDLFANLTVPTGMDSDHLEDVIMYKGAEFGVLYSDPNFMKMMIGIWSQKHAHTFERWIKALAIEYNPLENYDRMEEWDDAGNRVKTGEQSRSGNDTKSSEVSSTGTESLSHAEDGNKIDSRTRTTSTSEANSNDSTVDVSTTSTKGSSTDTQNTVSAFDSSTMQNDTRSVVDGTESDATQTKTTTSGTATTDGTASEAEQNNSADKRSSEDTRSKADLMKTSDSYSSSGSVSDSESEASQNRHKGRTHGNIGVTTSQQMLLQEWEVAKLNIYEEAADLFLSELTIYTY
jgi:hypothetical protein